MGFIVYYWRIFGYPAVPFIIYLVCLAFVLCFIFSLKRTTMTRTICLAILLLTFVIPYGWIAIYAWGAISWADLRMGS